MGGVLDLADDAARWLREHVAVGLGLAAGVVAILVVAFVVTRDDGGGKIPASALATVGGTPISADAVSHWQAVYTKASGTTKPTEAQARKAAFATLAQGMWIEQEAKRQGITVKSSDIDAAEKTLISQNSGTSKDQILKQLGMSETDLRYTERISLLTTALQKKVVKTVPAASSSDIQSAYEKQPGRWAHPSTRDVRILVAPSEKLAEQALAALKSGTTFSAASQKYSTATQLAQQGGAVKGLKPGSNDATLEVPLFSAQQGQLTGPIKTTDGWVVFRVQKIVPAADQSLSAATAKIKADIANTRQQAAVNTFVTALQKRWKAKTDCRASVKDTQFCSA